MKRGTKCLQEQPFANFPKEASRKDGHYPWCKPCLSDHRKDRYEKKTRTFFITHKNCTLCKEDKPRDAFRAYLSKNLHYRCIACEDEIETKAHEGQKKCSTCDEWKLFNAFYPSHRDKTRSECKECSEKYRKTTTVYERNRDRALKKHFGISLTQYREQLAKQDHKCPICLQAFEVGKVSYPVDHSHVDGKIRAILHDRCNRFVMWKHRESGQLRRAADLIDNPLTDWTVPDEFLKGPKRKRNRRVARSKSR